MSINLNLSAFTLGGKYSLYMYIFVISFKIVVCINLKSILLCLLVYLYLFSVKDLFSGKCHRDEGPKLIADYSIF